MSTRKMINIESLKNEQLIFINEKFSIYKRDLILINYYKLIN